MSRSPGRVWNLDKGIRGGGVGRHPYPIASSRGPRYMNPITRARRVDRFQGEVTGEETRKEVPHTETPLYTGVSGDDINGGGSSSGTELSLVPEPP